MRIREFMSEGGARLSTHQVDEIRQLHRQYGVLLGFQQGAGRIDLNGDAGVLATEVIRLAFLGAELERAARENTGTPVATIHASFTAEWDRRIRP